MVSSGPTTDHKRNWNREVRYLQVLWEVHPSLQGPHGEIKAECRQRQNLGHMPLLGSVGGVLWDSQAKAGLVNSKQKSRVLVSYMGSHLRGWPWEAEETVDHKVYCRSHIRNLICLWLCGTLSRACTCMRG